jgi:hypothetical protein
MTGSGVGATTQRRHAGEEPPAQAENGIHARVGATTQHRHSRAGGNPYKGSDGAAVIVRTGVWIPALRFAAG